MNDRIERALRRMSLTEWKWLRHVVTTQAQRDDSIKDAVARCLASSLDRRVNKGSLARATNSLTEDDLVWLATEHQPMRSMERRRDRRRSRESEKRS